jgi:hypothetical protein
MLRNCDCQYTYTWAKLPQSFLHDLGGLGISVPKYFLVDRQGGAAFVMPHQNLELIGVKWTKRATVGRL